MTPHDRTRLLDSVERWLRVLAGQYSRRVLPHERAEFFESFLHELRVEIFEFADRYDPARGAVTTWASLRAWRVMARTSYVRKRRVPTVELGEWVADPRAADPADPLEQADDFEAMIRPAQTGEQLALTLRFRDGLSLREIGTRLGGTTRQRALQVIESGLERIRKARAATPDRSGGVC